jgi:hypothetical protein
VYGVEPVGEDIHASSNALPPTLATDFLELRAALEVSPWTVGTPLVPANPTGLRIATIGPEGDGPGRLPRAGRERRVPIVQVAFP